MDNETTRGRMCKPAICCDPLLQNIKNEVKDEQRQVQPQMWEKLVNLMPDSLMSNTVVSECHGLQKIENKPFEI